MFKYIVFAVTPFPRSPRFKLVPPPGEAYARQDDERLTYQIHDGKRCRLLPARESRMLAWIMIAEAADLNENGHSQASGVAADTRLNLMMAVESMVSINRRVISG